MSDLILIPAFSGVLLSPILSPVNKMLMNSFYDIVNVPDLELAVDGKTGVDLELLRILIVGFRPSNLECRHSTSRKGNKSKNWSGLYTCTVRWNSWND